MLSLSFPLTNFSLAYKHCTIQSEQNPVLNIVCSERGLQGRSLVTIERFRWLSITIHIQKCHLTTLCRRTSLLKPNAPQSAGFVGKHGTLRRIVPDRRNKDETTTHSCSWDWRLSRRNKTKQNKTYKINQNETKWLLCREVPHPCDHRASTSGVSYRRGMPELRARICMPGVFHELPWMPSSPLSAS